MPVEIRNASFPVSVRGYDRGAVDAYVRRVNRVVAELEVSRSPQAAVRHAVDRVSEQTNAILQQARESAERITDTAREEAAEIIATAKAEAAKLVVGASTEADRLGADAEQVMANAQAEAEKTIAHAQAEAAEHLRRSDEEIAALQEQADARLRELEADTENVRAERRGLLGDMNQMANQLQEAASAAATRFSVVEETAPEPSMENEGEPTGVLAPDETAKRP
ncbi:MAG TPA: DivIVA domain-containing protein [Gaiellaceae bacterium]|nr:DivIVA domain-containing protein [Gaiellaceae bacterium]